MAAIYPHKKGGRKVFQVRFNLFFPDGGRKTLYRYRPTRKEATAVWVHAEQLENGSRAGSLTPEEIAQAQRDGLLKSKDVMNFSSMLMPAPQARELGKVIEMHPDGLKEQWSAGKILELLQGADAERQITQDMLVGLLLRLTGDPVAACHPSGMLPCERQKLSSALSSSGSTRRIDRYGDFAQHKSPRSISGRFWNAWETFTPMKSARIG